MPYQRILFSPHGSGASPPAEKPMPSTARVSHPTHEHNLGGTGFKSRLGLASRGATELVGDKCEDARTSGRKLGSENCRRPF